MQTLDITKPVKEIIIDKFNAKAGLSISYDQVELGLVEPLLVPTPTEDTSIKIVPTLLAPHINTFTLTYKRMNLIEIFSAPYLFVPSNGFTTLYALLADINIVVGLNISVDDVLDAPVLISTNNTVLIKAKPTSVLYSGQVELTLDTQLNIPTTSVESTSTVFVVHKNYSNSSYISAHSFDGFKSNAFKYLRNISLIASSNIEKIFSCEGDLIVVCGSFYLVAPSLPFINSATEYRTLTLSRDGSVISAREEESILSTANSNFISIDPINKFYYLVDYGGYNGTSHNKLYRLFENGTIDDSFNNSDISDRVINVAVCSTGFYVLSLNYSNYRTTINRCFPDGTIDPSFNIVSYYVGSQSDNLSTVCTMDEFGEEVLHVYTYFDYFTVNNAPTFTAPIVIKNPSSDSNGFFSPVFSIHDNGNVIKASSKLAQLNNSDVFINGFQGQQLLKALDNRVVMYVKSDCGILNSETLLPIVFGEDKEYNFKQLEIDKVYKINTIRKIIQTTDGHETYASITFQDPTTGQFINGVVSFDINHKSNGVILVDIQSGYDLQDIAILR